MRILLTIVILLYLAAPLNARGTSKSVYSKGDLFRVIKWPRRRIKQRKQETKPITIPLPYYDAIDSDRTNDLA